jgi:hypothetical protein
LHRSFNTVPTETIFAQSTPQLTLLLNDRILDVPVRADVAAGGEPRLAQANGTHLNRAKGTTTTYSPGGDEE